MGNAGKWDHWYAVGLEKKKPQPFGNTVTYKLGADWLKPCALVEDWGCGKGWLRRFVRGRRYRGVDGSQTPFAEVVADLVTYRSEVPGIFMRHVLEHDYEWAKILDNAVASFTERMALVLFTPLVDVTREVAFNEDPGVPDLAFAEIDLTSRFGDAVWKSETVESATLYGSETIFYLEKT